MDFSQDSRKVVDASTGRDPVEHSKRSARELGLPPIISPAPTSASADSLARASRAGLGLSALAGSLDFRLY